MTNLTAIRLRVLPRFPARIVGANGFAVVREDSGLVIQPDYEQLAIVPAVPDQEETFFQAWTRNIDTYNIIPFSALVANIQDVIIGDNLSSISDLSTATNTAIYFTGAGEAALYTISEFTRTISASEDADAFRDGLELGSAAVEDAAAFATAAQGTLADSSLQADDIGATVQAFSTVLQNIVDGVTPFGDMLESVYDPQGKAGDAFPYDSVADAEAAVIPATVGSVRLNGYYAAGDGGGGLAVDTDNGTDPWFTSSGPSARSWYHADPVLDVRSFGAVGDGVTDDTAAIGAAIDAGIALARKVYIPSATYVFDGYTNSDEGVTWDIEGDPGNWPQLIKSQTAADAGGYMFLFTDTRYSTVSGLTLATSVKPNQQVIELTSVTGLSVGMVLQISSDRLWYNGSRGTKYCGEIHKINDVDAVNNTVTIEDFTRDVYTLGVDTLTIRAWTPNKGSIRNLDIVSPYPATTVTSVGIAIQQGDETLVENVRLKGFLNSCILDNLGWKPLCRNVIFEQDDEFPAVGSNGYGIDTNGSVGMLVDGLKSKGLRRAFDADSITGTTEGAVTRDWKVINYQIVGGGAFYPNTAEISYGLGSHGPSENGTIGSGVIQDCRNGVTARGRNTIVESVLFAGTFFECISFHEEAAGLIVRGCTTENYNYPDKFSDLADIEADSGPGMFIRMGLDSGATGNCFYTLPVVIENNVCKGLRESFIRFGQNTELIAKMRVANNYIESIPGAAGTFTTFDAAAASTNWKSAELCSNRVRAINGSVVDFSSNLVLAYRDPSEPVCDWLLNGVFYARIPDDAVARIPRVARAGQRILVICHADANGYGHFRLLPNVGSLGSLGGSNSFGATAAGSALTGTTGADPSTTFGLEANGDLYIENRSGSVQTFRLTIQ